MTDNNFSAISCHSIHELQDLKIYILYWASKVLVRPTNLLLSFNVIYVLF